MSLDCKVTEEFHEVITRKLGKDWRQQLDFGDIVNLMTPICSIDGVVNLNIPDDCHYFYLGTSAAGTRILIGEFNF
jgi:hypothetical protein